MLVISIRNDKQDLRLEHAEGPIELGRGPERDRVRRCMIEDLAVSRNHLRVEEVDAGHVRLKNLSQHVPITLTDGTQVAAGSSRETSLPVRLALGQTRVTVAAKVASTAGRGMSGSGEMPAFKEPVPPPPPPAEALAAEGFMTIAAPVRQSGQSPLPAPPVATGAAPSPETLTQWMETVLALQRSGSGPAEFYAEAARAVVHMVGLDVGLVLLYRDADWQVVARIARDDSDSGRGAYGREFSQTVLRQVQAERRTFYQDIGQMKVQESLASIDAVVASPIFGPQDEVAGALYGMRRSRGRVLDCKIQPLEAQLVQLVAAAVGGNLARTAAASTRVQFEQFFSPELVRQLERDPGLLEGRGQEVTILVSDLRNFSALSEQLGPKETCRLIRDVMGHLSEAIAEQGGAIVSYLGDGILAMWNAPVAQPDHAVRACRAALAMQRAVPALSATWEPIVGMPLAVGVGVNTGQAQVGNTGSPRKFMYGPLGNTVNLASRVEGATKQLGVPILITGPTRALLDDGFVTRRLCQVRVAGISGSVDLYELYGESAPPEWLARRDSYEAGLGQFERRDWLRACQTLLPLLDQAESSGRHDMATLKLMRRCWSCLESAPEPFEPVLDLSGK